MPAKSKKQQRLMGQAYAYKTGELKAKDLNPEYADEIKSLAKSMTEKQLKDFAKTKHNSLPEKVDETIKRFDSFNESSENSVKMNISLEMSEESARELMKYFDSTSPKSAMSEYLSQLWELEGVSFKMDIK